eukprot:gene6472-10478_t
MKYPKYKYSLVPGPTNVSDEVKKIYTIEFPSPDLEDDFFELYLNTQDLLKEILRAKESEIIIQSGEAMVSLWGSLKSITKPNDKVLVLSTGLFGSGFGEMAKKLNCQIENINYEYDEVISDLENIRNKAIAFQPKIITVVHCETPCGTLNPIEGLGSIAKEVNALLYVDFVSSAIGTEVKCDEWGIDIGLLGTQKALSLPPDLGIITVSKKAMKIVEEIDYSGYDALLPFKNAVSQKYMPYTHNWRAIAALNYRCDELLKNGLENSFKKHQEVSEYCIKRIKGMNLKLFAKDEKSSAPTLTAVYVPENWTWDELNKELKSKGVCFGGNYGKLAGKIFRIGHLGSQADLNLVSNALDILEKIIKSK